MSNRDLSKGALLAVAVVAIVAFFATVPDGSAQGGRGAGPQQTAREAAPNDLEVTGWLW